MSEKIVDFVLTRIVNSQPSKLEDDIIFLNEQKPYFCGQTANNDIVCKGDKVAQKHCIFYCYPDDVRIQSLDSVYGVYVNGKKLRPYGITKLKNNDLIGIGTRTKDSSDLDKFIYQLQKKVLDDADREFCKRKLESKRNQSPSKLMKTSGTNSAIEDKRTEGKLLSRNEDSQSSVKLNPERINIVNLSETTSELQVQFMTEIIKNKTRKMELSNEKIIQEEERLEIPLQKKNIKSEKDSSANDQVLLSLVDSLELQESFEINNSNGSDSDDSICLYLSDEDTVYLVSDEDENENEKNEESHQNKEQIKEVLSSLNETGFSSDNQKIDSSENRMQLSDEDEKRNSTLDSTAVEVTDLFKKLVFSPDQEIFNLENIAEMVEENPVLAGAGEVFQLIDNPDKKCLLMENNIPLGINFDLNCKDSILENSIEENNCGNESSGFEETLIYKKVCRSKAKTDEVISSIVAWNYEHFVVGRYFKKRWSILMKNIVEKNLKSYETYEEYYSAQISLLLLDVACQVKTAIATINDTPAYGEWELVKNSAIKMITVRNSNLLGFDLSITVSNQSLHKLPAVGDLLRLELLNYDNSKPVVFGFVRNAITIDTETDKTQVVCAVMINLSKSSIHTRQILDLRIITSLLDTLNFVQALGEFKNSPLLPLIIKPELKAYHLPEFSKSKIIFPDSFSNFQMRKNLDYVESKQFHAVINITKAIINPEPKVCLIEGPTGTGKTKTIIDIVLTELKSNKRQNNWPPKILICARSNREVDEILIRLSSIKIKTGKIIKMVRIVHSEVINPQVKEFSLPILAKRQVDLGINEFLLSKEIDIHGEDKYREEIKLHCDEYNQLKNFSNAIKNHVLETCYKIADKDKNVKEINKQAMINLLDYAEKTLMSEANVFITTLSMCHSNIMDSVFGKTKEISVCIIDNAAQMSEIEILKPLTFGVKTLILLGDLHKNSFFETTDCNSGTETLDCSLFSRIKANFDGIKNSPIIKYDIQYRINEKLMASLSKLIFGENLRSYFSSVKFPLYPYTVFNFPQQTTDNDEASFLANMIFCITEFTDFTQVDKPMRIGVIVPVDSSKPGMMSAIKKSFSKTLPEKRDCVAIIVDTLLAFQNQERDLIIISCMNEIVGDKWLYTAISRTKHSLILYGLFNKLKKPCLLKRVIENAKVQNTYYDIKYHINPAELKNFLIN